MSPINSLRLSFSFSLALGLVCLLSSCASQEISNHEFTLDKLSLKKDQAIVKKTSMTKNGQCKSSGEFTQCVGHSSLFGKDYPALLIFVGEQLAFVQLHLQEDMPTTITKLSERFGEPTRDLSGFRALENEDYYNYAKNVEPMVWNNATSMLVVNDYDNDPSHTYLALMSKDLFKIYLKNQ